MSKKHNNRGGNNSKGNKAMKYMVRADIKVNGTVQRKDIICAIMGQTEGLLGDELELRKLHRELQGLATLMLRWRIKVVRFTD